MSRLRVFTEVLDSNPSTEVIQYLDERCTDGFGHFRGDRSGAEYAADLIISWIQEDALLLKFASMDILIELDGTDKTREFLPGTRVSATSDFVVRGPSGTRKLEVAYDATGHWRKKHNLDLRDSKLPKLQEESALLLGVAIPSAEGFVLDFAGDIGLRVVDVPFHFIYKKPVKSIVGVDSLLEPFDLAIGRIRGLTS
jgi:hypothetical protein